MATPGECTLRITVGRRWSDHSCVVSVNDFDFKSVTSSVEFQCIKTFSRQRGKKVGAVQSSCRTKMGRKERMYATGCPHTGCAHYSSVGQARAI